MLWYCSPFIALLTQGLGDKTMSSRPSRPLGAATGSLRRSRQITACFGSGGGGWRGFRSKTSFRLRLLMFISRFVVYIFEICICIEGRSLFREKDLNLADFHRLSHDRCVCSSTVRLPVFVTPCARSSASRHVLKPRLNRAQPKTCLKRAYRLYLKFLPLNLHHHFLNL